MLEDSAGLTRRRALQAMGMLGAAAALGCVGKDKGAGSSRARGAGSFRGDLQTRIFETPLVDVHEHLPDEQDRLAGRVVPCDDWGVLFSHYLDADLLAAGMPVNKWRNLLSPDVDPMKKWRSMRPYWPYVKNTGYGRAVRISIRELYGIDELDKRTIPRLQSAYEALRGPGMYEKILVDAANIESCQVNGMTGTFHRSRQPTLLMQDLSIMGMHMEPDLEGLAGPSGQRVRSLWDWHAVIRWWFDQYSPFAVAVKSQAAYMRGLDFDRVEPEAAAPLFKRIIRQAPVSPEDRKLVEDHLFWFCVDQATERGLPVKIHTGFLRGEGKLPLDRVAGHPAQAAALCRQSPETTFVFLHLCYPFGRELIAVAKQFANAHVDMSWAWIIDPAGTKDLLKSYLVTAPANKLLPFGGDYVPVECVLGHAVLARRGIARALEELVDEGWLDARDALELVEPILRGNARRIFRLDEKTANLSRAPWV